MLQSRLTPTRRIIEPMIELARCSKLDRIIVAGANSAALMFELHRHGYVRVATTTNCGLPAGQYDVALVDWRGRSIKALDTTLDWLVDFLSPAGGLVVWTDPPGACRQSKAPLAPGKAPPRGRGGHGARPWLRRFGATIGHEGDLQRGVTSDAAIRFAGLARRPNSRMAAAPAAFRHHSRWQGSSGWIGHGGRNRCAGAAVAAVSADFLSPYQR